MTTQLEITGHSLRHADRRAVEQALQSLRLGIADVVVVHGAPSWTTVICPIGQPLTAST